MNYCNLQIQILSNLFMSSSLKGKTGMIAPKHSPQEQRVVIKFLLSEGKIAKNISKRLKQWCDRLQHSDEVNEVNQ